MKGAPFTIRIQEITELDRLELAKEIPANKVSFERKEPAPDTYGELATATAIVIVSLAALRVIAVWLSKKSAGKDMSYTTEITNPDGKVTKTTLRITSKSSDSADAQVLKQLGEACKVDVSSLLKK